MDSIIRSQVAQIPHSATTTGFDLPGFRIVECLGDQSKFPQVPRLARVHIASDSPDDHPDVIEVT